MASASPRTDGHPTGTYSTFNPFFPPTSALPAIGASVTSFKPAVGVVERHGSLPKPVNECKGKQSSSFSPDTSAASAAASGNASSGFAGISKQSMPRSSQGGSSGGSDDDDDDADKSGSRSSHGSDSCTDYGGSESEESEEDDKPLAQAHPDALKAQKSLRQKERERASRSKGSKVRQTASPKKIARKSAQSGEPAQSQPVSRSASAREPASHQHKPLPRKKNTAPTPVRNPFGFAPDELSQKLKGVDLAKSRTDSIKQEQRRPESSGSRPHALLLPQTDEQVKRRNRSNGRPELAPPLAPFVQDSVLTMSEGSDDDDIPLRANTSVQSGRSMKRSAADLPGLRTADVTRTPSARQPVSGLASPTAPSAIIAPAELALAKKAAYHCKQRIYINDPQHHSSFDIDERTTPAHILTQLRTKNAISDNPAYVVVEMWRTLGVERTLREYEYLQDCIESWGNDSNASLFLVKKSNMAPYLTQAVASNSPSDAPGSWVQMETKRGKWSKRWLEIRNQSVFVGKSEKVSHGWLALSKPLYLRVSASPETRHSYVAWQCSMHTWFRKPA